MPEWSYSIPTGLEKTLETLLHCKVIFSFPSSLGSPCLVGEREVSLCLLGGAGAVPSCGDGVGEEVLPRERGADRRGEWVHLSSGPPGVVVPGPCGGGGVSPAAQLYQRDWSVGSAHAGGAAPAAGAGRGARTCEDVQEHEVV